MLLNKMRIKETRRIKNILESDSGRARRLYEMGFVPGTMVQMTHKTLFLSPFSVKIRGYEVILGSHDAKLIEVE